MKKTFKVIFLILVVIGLIIGISLFIKPKNTITDSEIPIEEQLTKLFDYVYDLGSYSDLNYKYAKEFFSTQNDNWGGKCTAVAKTLEDGTTLVGRNMDLNISNKDAYIFRTNIEGCHQTINLAYTFRDYSPDDEEVNKNGISKGFRDILPFMADDVLNDEGLYIEINMRHGELDEEGKSIFSCSGTNPEAKERIHVFMLPRYVGEHCATVEEALKYVKTLDLYTKDGYWNYCFLMADATGRYGVLEIAQNRLFWNEGAKAQTNFYVTPELNKLEKFKTGLGRYETVINSIDDVQNEEDMLNLMKKVNYYNYYSPETCEFDIRSEMAGELVPVDDIEDEAKKEYIEENINKKGGLTTDYLYKPEMEETIKGYAKATGEYVRSLTRKEQQDKNEYWESTFTEVINCKEKTLYVRFFEDDTRSIKLSFKK